MGVDVPDEGQRVLGVVGPEGDATQQADTVQGDTLAGEYEDEGEERASGIAIVEGMEEADVEIGTGCSGGQGQGLLAADRALGQARVEARGCLPEPGEDSLSGPARRAEMRGPTAKGEGPARDLSVTGRPFVVAGRAYFLNA